MSNSIRCYWREAPLHEERYGLFKTWLHYGYAHSRNHLYLNIELSQRDMRSMEADLDC